MKFKVVYGPFAELKFKGIDTMQYEYYYILVDDNIYAIVIDKNNTRIHKKVEAALESGNEISMYGRLFLMEDDLRECFLSNHDR